MFCPVIQIFPTTADLFTDSSGRVILDIWDQTALSINRGLEKYEEILTNERPEPIILSIPNTPKNFYYLKHLYDPATDYGNDVSIKVRITSGSDTFLHEYLFGLTKTSQEFEIKLVLEDSKTWADLLKNTLVKDLDLPTINFTKEDVEDKWPNNKLYLDGDAGYWYPVCFYGAWRVPNRRLVVEDLRPFVHATFLLQKMFEKIGWCFDSPFYETNFGRSLICYLLKKDYNNDEPTRNLRIFYASKVFEFDSIPFSPAQPVENWEELIDNGDNFDFVAGTYQNGFEGSFIIDVIGGDNPGFTGTQEARLAVIVKQVGTAPFQGVVTYIFQQTIDIGSNSNQKFEIPVNLLADQYAFVYFVMLNDVANVMPIQLNWSNKVDRSMFSKGDTIDLKKNVDQEMNCLDLFKGYQHLIEGIVEFDSLDKTLTLHTPYNANIFGETINGYYDNTFVDLITTQPKDTTKSTLGDSDRSRYVELGFAESTDKLLERKQRADGTEYFVKTVDLGNYYKNDTVQDRNPIFEGTILERSQLFGKNVFGNNDPYIGLFPALVDNEDGEISYDIKPRILFAVGYGQQTGAEIQQQFKLFNFEFAYQSSLAFACQRPDSALFNLAPIVERLVYGDEEGDLWTILYGKFFLQYNGRIKLDILSHLDNNTFLGINFRNIFQIEMDGHPIMGRILAITDYRPCEILSTPIQLMPELVGDQCFDSTPTEECNNNPSIVAEAASDCCFNLSIGGSFDCVVESVTWEFLDVDTWIEFATGESTQLCDINVITVVRAIITYDCDCPDSIISKTLNPCFNTLQCRLTQFVNETNQICVQWEYIGDSLCPFTFEVVINGGAYTDEPLTDPYLICGLEENTDYIFTVTFTFENGCDELVLDCEINTGDIDDECLNFPVLECVPETIDGITCFTWIITGSMTSEVETFIVTWSCDGVIGTWMPGDPPVCCSGTITATALVFFCDCPYICTEEVSCEGSGCTVVNAGTPILFLACS